MKKFRVKRIGAFFDMKDGEITKHLQANEGYKYLFVSIAGVFIAREVK